MTDTLSPAPTRDAGAVLELYRRDRAVHPYGIADVAQFWDRSTWWLEGEAAVGVMDLPGSAVPVLYAISAGADAETLDLLAALSPRLPAHFVITGPRGLTERLAERYAPRWSTPYHKMWLADAGRLPPAAADVGVLGPADVPDLEALFARDPDAGDFFHAGLLASGHYAGRRVGGALVAAAGVHVVDAEHGVAAMANVATHPDHRRRGHARAVVATLCHRLLQSVDVVGLNVRDRNDGARALYGSLGFELLIPYEEAELVARP